MSWQDKNIERLEKLSEETRMKIWQSFLDGKNVGKISDEMELDEDLVFQQVHICLENIDKVRKVLEVEKMLTEAL